MDKTTVNRKTNSLSHPTINRRIRQACSSLCLFVLIAFATTACQKGKVYDAYQHTPLDGWEKYDTLVFDVPPVANDALYSTDVGLRIDNTYPFMRLTLIIEHRTSSSAKILSDTIDCDLIGENGIAKGQGINCYQYSFHVRDTYIQQGDSLQVCIRHDMKREMLPGISDVGIKLSAHQVAPRIDAKEDKQKNRKAP